MVPNPNWNIYDTTPGQDSQRKVVGGQVTKCQRKNKFAVRFLAPRNVGEDTPRKSHQDGCLHKP